MTFYDLLNLSKENSKYAFILGMIYGWPKFENGNIVAFCTYKIGPKIVSLFNQDELNSLMEENKKCILNFFKDTAIQTSDISFINGASWSCSIKFKDNYNLSIYDEEKARALVYGYIEKHLLDFDTEKINYFISGMFNARGSLDFNHKLMAIDIEKKEYPNLTRKKYLTLSKLTGRFDNFNTRILTPSSTKNDQFRIKLDLFMDVYGLLIPFKIEYYQRATKSILKAYNGLFYDKNPDVKSSEYKNYNLALKINNLAINYQNHTISEEDILKYRIELGLENDDDIDVLVNSNPNIKEERKKINNYLCEIDNSHITFIARANNHPFVEGHHLIPFCKRDQFDVSIDIVENIVALCPICHRKIHLAVEDEKFSLLDELYDKNIDGLRNCGINLTKKELFSFYK